MRETVPGLPPAHRLDEECAERGPRLHAGIPVLRLLARAPGDVARVVERRKLGGGGEIGERDLLAAEPAARFRQHADLGHPGLQRIEADAQTRAIGIEPPHALWQDPLRDLHLEMMEEGGREAAHFGARNRALGHQRIAGARLLQILGHGKPVGDLMPVGRDENGQGIGLGGRKLEFEPLLREDEAEEAPGGRERCGMERVHGRGV